MTALVLPDYMGDLRAWTRTQPDLAPLHGGRVFFRLPETPVYPCIRLLDVSTVAQPGEAPVWDGRWSWIVWGGTPADYAAVSGLALALANALQHTGSPFLMGSSTLALNVGAVTVRDNPDPDTGAPRKVVDAVVTFRLA